MCHQYSCLAAPDLPKSNVSCTVKRLLNSVYSPCRSAWQTMQQHQDGKDVTKDQKQCVLLPHLDNKSWPERRIHRDSATWCLIGNGGPDQCNGRHLIPPSNLHNQFPRLRRMQVCGSVGRLVGSGKLGA